MIYGFSLLFLLLGLVVSIPALRKLLYMQAIKKKCAVTTGRVVSTKSAMNPAGWLFGTIAAVEVVNHERLLVSYRSPAGKEMSVTMVPSNFLSRRSYSPDESVEVAYDRGEPWRAYVIREWKAALREISIGAGVIVVAIVLWIIGYAYNLPW